MALGWRGQYFRYKEFFLNIANVYRQRPNLRVFLEIILSLSTVTVFLLFALKPTALTIISLIQEIGKKRETITTLDQKIGNLRTATTLLSQNRSNLPLIDSAVASTPKVDAVTKQVQGVAAKNGVTLSGLSIGQTVLFGKQDAPKKSTDLNPLPQNAKEMSVAITARGGYTNLLTFLADLENLRIANRIDISGINSATTEVGQIITISISVRLPFLSDNK